MSNVDLYNSEGKKVKDLNAPEELTAGPIRKGLLYYAVNYQMAKRRAGTHATRTRGMVVGSTRKLYRQKGTGRARHGDIKAPIYVGGGKAFGPHPRDYSYAMPKKALRRSLQTAIALKNKEGNLLAVEGIAWKEPKTKQALSFFKNLKADSALLVLAERNPIVEKSIRNLPTFKVLSVAGLNVYDILNHDKLIFAEDAIDKVLNRIKLSS